MSLPSSGSATSRGWLAALEARLYPARFIRIRRSAIVRLDQVRELTTHREEGEAAVLLRDGTRLPVSWRRLAEVQGVK